MGGKAVSVKAREALLLLYKSVEKYSPQIRRKLKKAGVTPDPALVYSAAKYYVALNKLAKE